MQYRQIPLILMEVIIINRNVESHFAELPGANIRRSKFDRGASYKTTLNAGAIVPFYLDEVLPGDTFDVTTSMVVRSQSMLTPVMDNIYLDKYFFFVPNRLVWDHWEEFCGENKSGPWAPTKEYKIPVIQSPPSGFQRGTIADYFGLPVGVKWDASNPNAPSALPFRAYALIVNEFFRDENLSDPLLIPTGDATQYGVNTGDRITSAANGGLPYVAARYHDRFSSCLPAPQKGAPVTLPIDNTEISNLTLPVYATSVINPLYSTSVAAEKISPLVFWQDQTLTYTGSGTIASGETTRESISAVGATRVAYSANNAATASAVNSTSTQSSNTLSPANLRAVGNISTSLDIGVNINDLRLAFAMQRYLEALARGGSRYQELILSLFGVHSPDARLQRPEYLGGNRVPINVHEVTNTAQSEQDFLGDVGAKSVTSDVNHDFVKSFTEHGYVIGLAVIRYDHSYSQGLDPLWTRKQFTDFYNPMFANLGEVPVHTYELYATEDTLKSSQVFGYQEIWSEYRYKPNMVTGLMRPGTGSLGFGTWSLADSYADTPSLSDGWIQEDKSNVDRALAVTSSVSPQFWFDAYVQNYTTRAMPMYSVPNVDGHF